MYRLVIAEKPSVAMSIAKVLGAAARKEGHMEGGGWLVSWCVGHLAGLAEPAVYDIKYDKWRREDLPILPENWRFTIGRDKREQFDILRTLFRREDVSEVVNACDAGREGELIFRTAYHLAGCTKPMKRLWISSMEDSAIREGFDNLRPGRDYDGLHQAALCRQKADWLAGINATRLFTVLYGRTLNIGRVMSPTLALIAQREAEIAAFEPVPFYTVELTCGGIIVTGERISGKEDAAAIAAACDGGTASIQTVERREKSERPPALYDLTTLQRDANRALGYTAQQTLDYLQALYEKKLCTYPRTDSRYLTDDMEGTIPALISAAAVICEIDAPETALSSQVCNSGKVTDHHAVVPTKSAAGSDLADLPLGEREILRLVAMGLLRAVCPPHRYAETAVTVECGGHSFTAKGKTVLDMGWKAYAEPTKDAALPDCLAEGRTLAVDAVQVKEGQTTPPKHFTEDNALGKLSDERYAILDAQYAKEQGELSSEITALKKDISTYEQGRKSAESFIALIEKYENFDTLTNTMLNKFVEKIVVHERDRKGSIDTTQEVEIYFNFVGRYVPPHFREVILTPEEQEALRRKEERKDKLHQNYLRRKASGAQKRYEDKIKAAKKAEIDAKKATIRAEDIANGVFTHVRDLPRQEPRKSSSLGPINTPAPAP